MPRHFSQVLLRAKRAGGRPKQKGYANISGCVAGLVTTLFLFTITLKKRLISANQEIMKSEVSYQYKAVSVAAFVQQLAVSYVRNGYWFYVTGRVPAGKDPARIHENLLQKYRIRTSKWERARRKRAGRANVHLLTCQADPHFFVLIATHGVHRFFEQEERKEDRLKGKPLQRIKDIREVPLKYAGYSIGYRKERGAKRWHPSVRIEQQTYRKLVAHMLDICTHRSVESMVKEFQRLPFEPWAPVRSQLFCLLKKVNKKRKTAGFTPVPKEAVRTTRRSVKVFEKEKIMISANQEKEAA